MGLILLSGYSADIHSFHYSDEHGIHNLETKIAPTKTKKQRLGL